MIKIELVGKSLFRVILGANILFLIRTIRARTLACVVNPAHEIVVVGFFADAGQVRGESPALYLVAFADRMAGQAAAGFKQFFSMGGVAGLLLGQRVGESGLPDISRDRLNLMIAQTEIRHFRRRTEIRRLLQPHRNPILIQLEPNILQVRPNLFHVLHQAVRLEIELLQTPVELAVGHSQINRLTV